MYGNKIMAVGFGLSTLGLGQFVPLLVPAAGVILFIGAVLVVIDK